MDFTQILHSIMQGEPLSCTKFFEDLLNETSPLNDADVPYMGNWMTVSELLSRDPKDYQVILSMIAYELTHKQRSQIIDRLISRFVNIIKTKAHANFAKSLNRGLAFREPLKAVRFDEKA